VQKLQELRTLVELAQKFGQEPTPELLSKIAVLEKEQQALEDSQRKIKSRIAVDLQEIFAALPPMEYKPVVDESLALEQLKNLFLTVPQTRVKPDPVKEPEPQPSIIEPEIVEASVEPTVIDAVVQPQPVPMPSLAEKTAKVISEQGVVAPEPVLARPQKDLAQEVKYLREWIGRIAATGTGGGEVNLRFLDDIDRASIGNGKYLNYNASTKKFQFSALTGGGAPQVQSDWTDTNSSNSSFILNKPVLATVATSGSYADLSGKPTIPVAQVQSNWTETSSSSLAYILNKPVLANVAISGNYADLAGLPGIPAAQVQSNWTDTNSSNLSFILNKPVLFSGSYTDLTNRPNNFVFSSDSINVLADVDTVSVAPTVGQVLKWTGSTWAPGNDNTGSGSSTAQIQSNWTDTNSSNSSFILNKPVLATVATSGSYTDLINRPTIPAAQIQSNWTETSSSSLAYILNKPVLATVATSGSYADLSGKPSIPAAQIQVDWNQTSTSSLAYILNKPTIPAAQIQVDWNQTSTSSLAYILNKPVLATVATSGSYADLSGRPTIPAAQVQSNWTETSSSSLAYILNKPVLATVATSGSYADLSNKPTIPAAQIQVDWNQTSTSSLAFILNKPALNQLVNSSFALTLNSAGNTTVPGALSVSGSVNVYQNLTVNGIFTILGTSYTVNSTNASYADSIIEIHNTLGSVPLVSDDGQDIGLRFHYYKAGLGDKNAFLGMENSDQVLEYIADGSETSGVFTGVYGAFRGSQFISMATTGTAPLVVSSTTRVINLNAATAGTADAVINGVYTTGSYSNPSWITALAYSKLTGAPTIPAAQIQADWNQTSTSSLAYILNKPVLATVATSGLYNDLTGAPTIPAAQIQADWNQTSTSSLAYILNKPVLATVATSGSYADLSGKPSIPAAQVQSNWTETSSSSLAYILNKPVLATVATSGLYNDLTGRPTIPAAQIQSDWNQTSTSSLAYILNKPVLATVATSGSYADLSGRPTIPAAQVQSNWTETSSSSLAYILNKPVLATVATTGSYTDLINQPGTQAEKTATTALATTAFVDRLRSLSTPTTQTSGTLVIGDRGALIQATSSITVPALIFGSSDVVSIFNNTSVSISIFQSSGLTLYLMGSSTTGTRTLAGRGLVTITFINSSVAVIGGGGLT
jgi:hypothetical protein